MQVEIAYHRNTGVIRSGYRMKQWDKGMIILLE